MLLPAVHSGGDGFSGIDRSVVGCVYDHEVLDIYSVPIHTHACCMIPLPPGHVIPAVKSTTRGACVLGDQCQPVTAIPDGYRREKTFRQRTDTLSPRLDAFPRRSGADLPASGIGQQYHALDNLLTAWARLARPFRLGPGAIGCYMSQVASQTADRSRPSMCGSPHKW